MSWVTRNLTSIITTWTIASRDGYGKPTWTKGSAKGRWEQRQEKAVDPQGNEFLSNAVVFLDTDVTTGDYLYQGTSTESSPPSTAREVKAFTKIPDIRGVLFERKAILK